MSQTEKAREREREREREEREFNSTLYCRGRSTWPPQTLYATLHVCRRIFDHDRENKDGSDSHRAQRHRSSALYKLILCAVAPATPFVCYWRDVDPFNLTHAVRCRAFHQLSTRAPCVSARRYGLCMPVYCLFSSSRHPSIP